MIRTRNTHRAHFTHTQPRRVDTRDTRTYTGTRPQAPAACCSPAVASPETCRHPRHTYTHWNTSTGSSSVRLTSGGAPLSFSRRHHRLQKSAAHQRWRPPVLWLPPPQAPAACCSPAVAPPCPLAAATHTHTHTHWRALWRDLIDRNASRGSSTRASPYAFGGCGTVRYEVPRAGRARGWSPLLMERSLRSQPLLPPARTADWGWFAVYIREGERSLTSGEARAPFCE